jgi:hypothetical protein
MARRRSVRRASYFSLDLAWAQGIVRLPFDAPFQVALALSPQRHESVRLNAPRTSDPLHWCPTSGSSGPRGCCMNPRLSCSLPARLALVLAVAFVFTSHPDVAVAQAAASPAAQTKTPPKPAAPQAKPPVRAPQAKAPVKPPAPAVAAAPAPPGRLPRRTFVSRQRSQPAV